VGDDPLRRPREGILGLPPDARTLRAAVRGPSTASHFTGRAWRGLGGRSGRYSVVILGAGGDELIGFSTFCYHRTARPCSTVLLQGETREGEREFFFISGARRQNHLISCGGLGLTNVRLPGA